MDPVWTKNLDIYRQMTEDQKDVYMTQLNDSLIKLNPKAREIVISYMEFLSAHGELTAEEEAANIERASRPPVVNKCTNCADRYDCSPGFGRTIPCNPDGD